jgi:hypothetical protein
MNKMLGVLIGLLDMMNLKTKIILITIFVSSLSVAEDFNWKYLKHDGSATYQEKSEIIRKYGSANKVFPNYDCGFHAGDENRGPYYQLKYQFFKYIGIDSERFTLEEFNFSENKASKLSYKGKELSDSLSKSKFSDIFGEPAIKYFKKYPEEETIRFFSMTSDDAADFKFKNGKLALFTYWSDC